MVGLMPEGPGPNFLDGYKVRLQAQRQIEEVRDNKRKNEIAAAAGLVNEHRLTLEENQLSLAQKKEERAGKESSSKISLNEAQEEQTRQETKEAKFEGQVEGYKLLMGMLDHPDIGILLSSDPSPEVKNLLSVESDILETLASGHFEDDMPIRKRPGETPREHLARAIISKKGYKRIIEAFKEVKGDDTKPAPNLEQHERTNLNSTVLNWLGFAPNPPKTTDERGEEIAGQKFEAKAGDLLGTYRITQDDIEDLEGLAFQAGDEENDKLILGGSKIMSVFQNAVQRVRKDAGVSFEEAKLRVLNDFDEARSRDQVKKAQDVMQNRDDTRQRRLLQGPGGPSPNSGISPRLSNEDRKKLKQTLDGDRRQLGKL